MTSTLPVPIVFELPDSWVPADPDSAGAPGAAFVARLPGHEHFAPTITVDGSRMDPAEVLADVAAGSVVTLSNEAESVEVLERRDTGSDGAPGLFQALGMTVRIAGRTHDLVQDQVYVVFADQHDPTQRAVVRVVVTVSRNEHSEVLGDFSAFVRSVALDRS